MSKPESMKINEVEYVRKDSMHNQAEKLDGLDYVVVRTYSAGVVAGYLESREGKECWLRKYRKIWYWDGAAGIEGLATDGTSKPQNCKFLIEVDRGLVTEAIQVIYCTEKARKSIQGVKVWVA